GDHFFGRAALRAIQRGMVGIEIKNSITLWITVSIAPPKYPDIPPIMHPRTKLRATPIKPMDKEMRAA
ncbi:unnamed protein product, partial [marine sediment metagenome]